MRQHGSDEQHLYYREMAELAKQITGAIEAHVFNHFIWSPRLAEDLEGVDGFYASAPHNDYTPAGGKGCGRWQSDRRGLADLLREPVAARPDR